MKIINLVFFKMLMTSQNGFKMSQNLIKIYKNLYNLQHKSYISGNCYYSQEFLNLINDHILKYHEYFCDVNILPCYGLMVTVNIRLLSLIKQVVNVYW